MSRALDRLDAVFAALSDPTRRAILSRLVRGECSVTTLGSPFAVSAPAISKHLRVLESSGLITRHKSGRVHYCRLRADSLREAGDWIEQQRAFWEHQFDSLASYLDKEEGVCSKQSHESETRSVSKEDSRRRVKKSSGHGQIPRS